MIASLKTQRQPSMCASNGEKVFVIGVLLFSSGAFASVWTVPRNMDTAAGMPIMQVVWLGIYVVALSFLFRYCKRPLRSLLMEWPLFTLCALAMVSVVWSDVPDITLRRSLALLLTVFLGLYLSFRFSLKQQLRLLAWTCGICIVSSFVFGILGLGNSVDSGEGVLGWYGIFDQKNALGRMMVFGVLVFLFWKRAEPEQKTVANLGLLGSVGLIGLSRSMTSVIVCVTILMLLPFLRWSARKRLAWMLIGIIFAAALSTAAVIFVVTHVEEVTGLLGRSATLSGRVPIWILSTVMALRRPWLGYGYNAFWLPNQIYTVKIWQVLGWKAPHAHDGFLEIWLELGLVGVGLFFVVFAYYAIRGIKFSRDYMSTETAMWPITFLIFLFLSNLTEADLLSRNNIFFILFVALAFSARADRNHGLSSQFLSKPSSLISC